MHFFRVRTAGCIFLLQAERERIVRMMEELATSAETRVFGLQEQLSVAEREAARAKAARTSDRALCQKYRNELEEERNEHQAASYVQVARAKYATSARPHRISAGLRHGLE